MTAGEQRGGEPTRMRRRRKYKNKIKEGKMNKLAELKEKLKELSPEELEELKTFITTDETGVENAEAEKTEAIDTTIETKEDEKVEDPNTEKKAEENTDAKTEPLEEVLKTEEKPAEVAETTATDEVPTEDKNDENKGTEEAVSEPKPETEEDDIPIMTKGKPSGEEGAVDEGSVTAETGETLPIDYEQIIEGQNAKIAALEAENASLKNKVNGAFGYSAKPTTPAKVNRLYDECEDVHFHR